MASTFAGRGWNVDTCTQDARLHVVGQNKSDDTIFTPTDVGFEDMSSLRVFLTRSLGFSAAELINELNHRAEFS